MDKKILDLLNELWGVKEDHEEGQDNNAAQEKNEEATLATFEFYFNSNNDLCCKTEATTALSKKDLEQIFPKRIRSIIGQKLLTAIQTNYEKEKAQEAQNGTDTDSL